MSFIVVTHGEPHADLWLTEVVAWLERQVLIFEFHQGVM
jgi:hypothetical protein